MKAWCFHPIKVLLNQVVGKAIMSFFSTPLQKMCYTQFVLEVNKCFK